jgi:ABC-2 type transport system permease protein
MPSEAVLARPRFDPGFRGLWAFFLTEFRVQIHEGTAIVTSIIVQVVLLTFVWVLNPALLGVALVGAIVFSAFALGGRVQNEAAFVRVDHRLNQLYLASPLTPEAYFLGMSLGVLVAYLPPILLLVTVAEVVIRLPFEAALLLFLTTAAVWVFACSFGYVVSTLFRDMRAIWPWAALFFTLFGVLPPVFYPFDIFPAGLRWIALLIPPSAATAIVQGQLGMTEISSSQVALAAVSLTVIATGMFLFAIYWARRTVRED